MRTFTIYGKSYFLVFLLALSSFLSSCSVDRQMARKTARFFNQAPLLNDHPIGFALADLNKGTVIFEKDADKYFVPASNTKLFTFYAGLKMLGDSVPALRYVQHGDSLIFWGTGDPSLLQSRIKATQATDFLKSRPEQLFFAAGRYTGNFYGQGWSWDDYNDYYQAEITELPLMDNLVAFTTKSGRISVMPQHFKDCLEADSLTAIKDFNIIRDFHSNRFSYPAKQSPSVGYEQLVPYQTSTAITVNLLADTLKKPVQLIRMEMPVNAKTIYGAPSEQVLREMMLPSDNFIAEQLLLVYCNQFQRNLNSTEAINYVLAHYLADLPDKPRWVDGSGLSRMNLFTPRDIIFLLRKIDQEVHNREKLYSLLPAGGKTGTLKNAYPKTDHPFVYGKTGSLSGVYNQSGYLLTKKGRVLAFSLLNNNFVTPVGDLKAAMAKMMIYIHDNF